MSADFSPNRAREEAFIELDACEDASLRARFGVSQCVAVEFENAVLAKSFHKETAMNTTLTTHFSPPAKPIFQRFLWKEYRMLRGFWLAVGGLAMIVQFVLPHLQYDARSLPGQLFAVAWGAAALYAVGAAITLFSAEREERTRDFLQVLPDRWLPMFAGKVLLGLFSAVALALVLSFTGWFFAENRWPTAAVMNETLGVVGVAVVEATVWGLLFSLWMKQPLLAAIVSMAAASFGAQLAVVAASPNDPTAYSQAVPMRLLLCFGVFLADLWLASRWLHPAPSPGFFKRRSKTLRETIHTLQSQTIAADSQTPTRPRRRRMFASLLWQTWRESWKTMLAAVPIALLLMIAIVMAAWLSKTEAIAVFLCPLLLPALFGALVFRADQRRGHRQFLVAHAGPPRYVWFARHAVWLTALIAIGCLLYVAADWLFGEKVTESIRHEFHYMSMYGHQPTAWSTASTLQYEASMFWSFLKVGGCAMLSAYGLGQLCSMLLSREVLAGFLAMLLAAVLTAWAIVVGVWELNAFWFVLPIGIATMAATWLRAPDWIVGRNSPRAWLAPAMALVVPLGLVFMTLPQARLAQIAMPPTHQLYNHLQEPLADSLKNLNATQADARATATTYEQLRATLVPWEEATKDVRVDGKRFEDIKFLQTESAMGFDDSETPTPEGIELGQRFADAHNHAHASANQHVIEELESLSKQDFIKIATAINPKGHDPWDFLSNFLGLLVKDASRLIADDQLELAFDRYLVASRIRGQLFSHQSTQHVQNALRWHEEKTGLDKAILAWAQHPDQTSENLKKAIRDLQEVYANYPKMRDAVLADHLQIRDVLLEKEPARFFHEKNKTWKSYLPFLANKLSWERERALQSLDILTGLRLNFIDHVTTLLGKRSHREDRRYASQKKLSLIQALNFPNWQSNKSVNESAYQNDWDAYTAAQHFHRLCRTNYLLADEIQSRVDTPSFLAASINAEVAHRGLLLQLALLAYRLDHDEYPESLEDLSPEYFADVPFDPYALRPFEYRPDGLDLPLRLSGRPDTEPNTPLLWSVGRSQSGLWKTLAEKQGHGEGMGGYGGEMGGYGEMPGEYGGGFYGSEEPQEKRSEPEMVYALHISGSYWGTPETLVFLLPK